MKYDDEIELLSKVLPMDVVEKLIEDNNRYLKYWTANESLFKDFFDIWTA